MTKVVVHIDGSSIKGIHSGISGSSRKWSMGYGAVICFDGNTVELSGSRLSPTGHSGSHEFYSFIETALYLHRAGIRFEDVSLYTDDQQLSYAHFAFHPGNHLRTTAMELMNYFEEVMRAYKYSYSDIIIVLNAIASCHIRKIKGHSGLVYSERVDYLAKTAAQRLANEDWDIPMLSFLDWLKQGVCQYRNGVARTWYAAFCSPESDMLI